MPKKKGKGKKAAAQRSAGYFGPDADGRPSEAEWKRMEAAEELVTTKCKFRHGCDAIINSPDGTENIWIAKVLGLKRRNTPEGIEGWALVRWYYSVRDIKEIPNFVQNLDMNSFSAKERVFSDVYDLVRTDTLASLVYIRRWNEEELDPPKLDSDCYFTRYDLKGVYTTTPTLQPFPGEYSCICHHVYDPFPPADVLDIAKVNLKMYIAKGWRTPPERAELTADYMHFCPRPSCGRWFHETCLLHQYHTSDHAAVPPGFSLNADFVGTPAVRRLAADPDCNAPHRKLKQYLYTKPARGKMSSEGPPSVRAVLQAALHAPPDVDALGLPDPILEIATMPIVRRAGEGKASAGGAIADVVLARRMVYARLERCMEEFARLESSLPDTYYSTRPVDHATLQAVWQYLGTQRLLASPRLQYWEERYAELAAYEPRPVLHCPECRDKFPVAI